MNLKFLVPAVIAAFALASCGSDLPPIDVGGCNGHVCPVLGGAATGASSSGASAPAAATGATTPLPVSAEAVPAAATGAAEIPAPIQGIAVGEPNPSAPLFTGGTDLAAAAPSGVVNGFRQDQATLWWLPVGTPEFKAQKLDAVLTPDAVTARINAEGGWRYWHTYRTLPGGTTYFFVVGPTQKPDEAGWYANFQLPAVDGSGAWLATILLETTPARPQAFGGLADMYKGIVKTTGIPTGGPLEIFKAAADGFKARLPEAPMK